MSDLLYSRAYRNENYDYYDRRKSARRQTSDRRLFQRCEPGKITIDRRKALSDRRTCENKVELSLI